MEYLVTPTFIFLKNDIDFLPISQLSKDNFVLSPQLSGVKTISSHRGPMMAGQYQSCQIFGLPDYFEVIKNTMMILIMI